jgi:type I restriction enzyme S subunit
LRKSFYRLPGQAPEKTEHGILLITARNIKEGSLDFSEAEYIDSENYEEWMSRGLPVEGDVLLTTEAPLGNVAQFPGGDKYALAQRVITLRGAENKLDNSYLMYFFLSSMGKRALSIRSSGTTAIGIRQTELRKVEIALPPIREQRRIARVLKHWSCAIDYTKKLIAAKVLRKRGLMQQLLNGKRRFQEFAEREWEEVKLSDVFERVTRKNDEGNTNVVTVSAQRGFVRQNEFFNRLVASENTGGYFLVKRGEFCYNKSYTNDYAWGATKRLKDFEKAVVTTLYICFRIKDEARHSGDFLEQLFEACLLDRGLTKIAHEGGRAHGLLNVTPFDFFNLKITIPTYAEQVAIAKILQTADREIDLLKKQLVALKRQKRGLMQKLLTGQIRVKVNKDEAAVVEAG